MRCAPIGSTRPCHRALKLHHRGAAGRAAGARRRDGRKSLVGTAGRLSRAGTPPAPKPAGGACGWCEAARAVQGPSLRAVRGRTGSSRPQPAGGARPHGEFKRCSACWAARFYSPAAIRPAGRRATRPSAAPWRLSLACQAKSPRPKPLRHMPSTWRPRFHPQLMVLWVIKDPSCAV